MHGNSLLIVVNDPGFFVSHRLPIAIEAKQQGFEVGAATPEGDAVATIESAGITHYPIRMTRSGVNPFDELRSVLSIAQVIRRTRPDIVHLVTIKPVLYGGIVARMLRVPALVSAVSGLGTAFTDGGGPVAFLRKWLALTLYRLALKHGNQRVIVQNQSDRAVLTEYAGLVPEKTLLLRGSGVDLEKFAFRPEPRGPVVALFAARLLASKGIREFVDAARRLGERGSTIEFCIAGLPDPGNPSSVTQEEFESWDDAENIRTLGHRTDMENVLAEASIVALPSYYGEGLPKVLIEAAACGRAVITTDFPGCRDAIEPGRSGLLVAPRSSDELADAIESLAGDPETRRAMGRAGRALAEKEYDIRHIVERHIDAYHALLARQ